MTGSVGGLNLSNSLCGVYFLFMIDPELSLINSAIGNFLGMVIFLGSKLCSPWIMFTFSFSIMSIISFNSVVSNGALIILARLNLKSFSDVSLVNRMGRFAVTIFGSSDILLLYADRNVRILMVAIENLLYIFFSVSIPFPDLQICLAVATNIL